MNGGNAVRGGTDWNSKTTKKRMTTSGRSLMKWLLR